MKTKLVDEFVEAWFADTARPGPECKAILGRMTAAQAEAAAIALGYSTDFWLHREVRENLMGLAGK